MKYYVDGKLHGDNITYNELEQVIKHELFSKSKCVAKYLYEAGEKSGVDILDQARYERLLGEVEVAQ